MFKFLILAGGAYLLYKSVKKAVSGMFGKEKDSTIHKGEQEVQSSSFSDEDVVDVDFREVPEDEDKD
ncbi:MAG TPA: hypothetical protein ENH10_05060 [Bacteroidetes bacterium]|nr:hypothetical protein BMS3Bbin04_01835 [bacterium BMS3Bbin04]HDO65386.1 hypothetical protein [Bacteroidota bacterium]HEX04511.1 hypothetical protein [Bacteroidota bacterium]